MSTGSDEQLRLFDLGLNLSAIRAAKEKHAMKVRAKNTENAYSSSWKIFTNWCGRAGRSPLPATSDTLELFVTWCLFDHEYSPSTVHIYLAAIAHYHKADKLPLPATETARELLASARVTQTRSRNEKDAITPDQLTQMLRNIGNSAVGCRDRAYLVFGFATGLRRSEIVSLELRDVKFEAGGDLMIHLRKSKTDQEAVGRYIRVHPGKRVLTCPVRQMRRWIELRGDWSGPLFCSAQGKVLQRKPISGRSVCDAVHRGLERIDVDSKRYGAHSLRSGFVTAAADNGASEIAIRARTGHRTLGMLARYVRDRNGMRINPLKGVL